MIVLTALLAGTVHVLSGPDHMAAVAPLAIADRRRGWVAGWTWGLGHASGVVVVAVPAVLLRDLLPAIDAISFWGERLVGAALIAVGFWAARSALQIGTASHTHDGAPHAHVHVQRGPAFARRIGHAHTAFLVGVLHGAAGSSHFLGLLPALALPSRGEAFTYIAVFGAATVASMPVFAALLGAAAGRASLHGGRMHRALVFTGAAVAFVGGGAWLVG